MILKIQRIGSNEDKSVSWAMFSDILNVYYVTITGEKFKDSIRTHKKLKYNYPFDYTQVFTDSKRVVIAEATRKNGSMLHLAFNDGYLLNDNGKTIERLV